MPGVVRPYTLPDVLAQIIGGSSQPSTTDVPTGQFAEADEAIAVGDDVTGTVQAPKGWDNTVWGAFTWQ